MDYLTQRYNITLSECEKLLIRQDLRNWSKAAIIFANAKIAESKTIEIFNINGWRDCADAFRHAYWNALNVVSLNYVDAIIFATAHECQRPTANLAVGMDYFNNEIGRGIGLSYNFNSTNSLWSEVLEALHNGELRVISNLDSDKNYTSNSELIGFSNCQL